LTVAAFFLMVIRRTGKGSSGVLEQYAILLGLTLGAVGFVLSLFAIARAVGKSRNEPGKDVPATAGLLSRDPVWVRYHARYYGYALLFLAFDMEMAFMYPLVGRLPPGRAGGWWVSLKMAEVDSRKLLD
jgi:NADH:ubiquinone oxidoreductase subunit 3 (subunit A)